MIQHQSLTPSSFSTSSIIVRLNTSISKPKLTIEPITGIHDKAPDESSTAAFL